MQPLSSGQDDGETSPTPRWQGEYPMELLHIDVAGPFEEGLDGSHYWLTIVYDYTGWIEIIPILRGREFVIESLRIVVTTSALSERADAYA
ncbi:hypothetical protein PMIN03_012886 [Paraphaeosphaeria minitans]